MACSHPRARTNIPGYMPCAVPECPDGTAQDTMVLGFIAEIPSPPPEKIPSITLTRVPVAVEPRWAWAALPMPNEG